MPVRRALLASGLGLCVLLPGGAGAETAVAALDWQRPTPPPAERELDCLALNVYWEARSESLLGRTAVAAVTLNRVASPSFPDSVCEVVFQGEERGRHLCQFSWRCDGRTDRPANPVAWEEARRVARVALSHGVADPTGGALWYHADHVLPAWAAEMTLRARIGRHLFYARADRQDARPRREAGGTRALETFGADAARVCGAAAGSGASCRPFVPPSPLKPVLASPAPADPTPEAPLAAGLRIDFEQDPVNGLLLCDDGALCGTTVAPFQATDKEQPSLPVS